jgi:lipopolysaccharide biosynthesis glycosyltransferase
MGLTITVVIAADGNFHRQLAVTLFGLSRFAGGVPHRVYVLHDGYDAEVRDRFAGMVGSEIELCWLDARSTDYEGANLPDFLPEATLYRLHLPRLLPDDVERVVFLDSDIVVQGSLVDLWGTELGEAPVAAVRDAIYPSAGSRQCLDWRTLGLSPSMPYFNAGVMLIGMDAWRARAIGGRALALIREHDLRYGDQCALNTIVRGEWHPLAPTWNVQTGHLDPESPAWIVEPEADLAAALERPTIVHYTNFEGIAKPWQDRSQHPLRSRWFEDLDRTPWAGWRPDDSPPSRAREGLRRARRAAGVLRHGR